MKVWQVGVSDCESCYTICICATKEIALREMFKKRDELIAEWKKGEKYSRESIKKFCKKENKPVWIDPMYPGMIKALSSDDYKKWDNYPHDCPWIKETNVLED